MQPAGLGLQGQATGAHGRQCSHHRHHLRKDLTLRLSDTVKLVAAQHPRDAARAAAYFRFGLLQAPEAPAPAPTNG